ncbi:MAG: helix-turn-helix transcriptional regulator [Candidatus Acidiferrales bacterium]
MRPQGPDLLVFSERSTGASRFQVELNGDREAAMDRAASLLALGCMARGELPKDYAIWVPADKSLIECVTKRAEELLRLGHSLSCSIPLSPREGEVLKELMRNRLNKEIADRLCISVRTVKFHVSSLLAKFGVASRWDLIQKAQRMLGTRQLPEDVSSSPAQSSGDQSPSKERTPQNDWRERKQEQVVPFRARRLHPA